MYQTICRRRPRVWTVMRTCTSGTGSAGRTGVHDREYPLPKPCCPSAGSGYLASEPSSQRHEDVRHAGPCVVLGTAAARWRAKHLRRAATEYRCRLTERRVHPRNARVDRTHPRTGRPPQSRQCTRCRSTAGSTALFGPDHYRGHTVAASDRRRPTTSDPVVERPARTGSRGGQRIADPATRLRRYRAALNEVQRDVIGGWIARDAAGKRGRLPRPCPRRAARAMTDEDVRRRNMVRRVRQPADGRPRVGRPAPEAEVVRGTQRPGLLPTRRRPHRGLSDAAGGQRTCRRGDLNPHGINLPLAPQASASAIPPLRRGGP